MESGATRNGCPCRSWTGRWRPTRTTGRPTTRPVTTPVRNGSSATARPRGAPAAPPPTARPSTAAPAPTDPGPSGPPVGLLGLAHGVGVRHPVGQVDGKTLRLQQRHDVGVVVDHHG